MPLKFLAVVLEYSWIPPDTPVQSYAEIRAALKSNQEATLKNEGLMMEALSSLDLVACASRFIRDSPGLEHIFFTFARRQQPSAAFQRLREADGSIRLERMDEQRGEAAWQQSAFNKYSWQ